MALTSNDQSAAAWLSGVLLIIFIVLKLLVRAEHDLLFAAHGRP